MKPLTGADPATKSADLLAENVERLKALFPEACTEGKIDFDALRQLLGGAVDEREEKYGLNWHGKRRGRQLALTLSTGTLRPCPEDSVDWATTRNLMIEGDNLEVLKLARNLLRQDGVIFISIDEGEISNLRKICDEIFGEENFLANFVGEKRTKHALFTKLRAGHPAVSVLREIVAGAMHADELHEDIHGFFKRLSKAVASLDA